MRVDLAELLACPCCGKRMVFKGDESGGRFQSGYFSCPSGHLYQVKEEIGLFKEGRLSANEFEWKVDVADETRYEEVRRRYDEYLGEERRTALRKMQDHMIDRITEVALTSDRRVLDVASGMGTFVLPLAEKSSQDFHVVATDIDEKPLRGLMGKARRIGVYGRISLLVTDAKHLAFKSGVLSSVSSFFGFDNVPDASLALREAARVLRVGGRVIFCSLGYEENSKSVALADEHSVGELASEDRLRGVLEGCGFALSSLEVFYSGVWPHNPMDLLPIEGERYEHVVIEAVKL